MATPTASSAPPSASGRLAQHRREPEPCPCEPERPQRHDFALVRALFGAQHQTRRRRSRQPTAPSPRPSSATVSMPTGVRSVSCRSEKRAGPNNGGSSGSLASRGDGRLEARLHRWASRVGRRRPRRSRGTRRGAARRSARHDDLALISVRRFTGRPHLAEDDVGRHAHDRGDGRTRYAGPVGSSYFPSLTASN